MKTLPVPLELGNAACANPVHLPLVDAAHAKPGGLEAQQMKRTLCRTCPVADACLEWAMTHGETGIWGGISPQVRASYGAPKRPPTVRDSLAATMAAGPVRVPRQHFKPYRPSNTTVRLAALGITESTVRAWAYEQGIARTRMGRVSLAHVEAWAAAHRTDDGRTATPDA